MRLLSSGQRLPSPREDAWTWQITLIHQALGWPDAGLKPLYSPAYSLPLDHPVLRFSPLKIPVEIWDIYKDLTYLPSPELQIFFFLYSDTVEHFVLHSSGFRTHFLLSFPLQCKYPAYVSRGNWHFSGSIPYASILTSILALVHSWLLWHS